MTKDTHDAIQTILVGVDQMFRDSEAKWGVGRLVRLVSDPVRAAFKRGFDRWNAAVENGDLAVIQDLAPKMRQAVAFMDSEATSLGHAPLSPEAWEARLEDGRVLIVVRTQAEAGKVSSTLSGRSAVVWTMDELAMVLPKLETIHAVKTCFPGSIAEQVVLRREGEAQRWVSNDDWARMHQEDALSLQEMYRDAPQPASTPA